ncbi:hypothetical protein ACLOJK_030972 [Asimina triloba]
MPSFQPRLHGHSPLCPNRRGENRHRHSHRQSPSSSAPRPLPVFLPLLSFFAPSILPSSPRNLRLTLFLPPSPLSDRPSIAARVPSPLSFSPSITASLGFLSFCLTAPSNTPAAPSLLLLPSLFSLPLPASPHHRRSTFFLSLSSSAPLQLIAERGSNLVVINPGLDYLGDGELYGLSNAGEGKTFPKKDRDQVLYALFLTMQDDYLNGTGTMPVSEFCLKVAKIFQGHDDLLKEYESFLRAESRGDAFEYASFGRNLSGITLEQSSFDLPSAWRVNRGKELLKFGNKQRRRKMDDKELDCDSNMKKQIKRMRAEKNAESSKDKELENTPCCAFNKISSGNSNDLVSEQLTKANVCEGYLLNSNGCTPSYHLLENYPVPQASYMEDCDASVLNDIVKLVPSSTGGGVSGPKQSAEDLLDDARFELDVLISSIKDAIKDGKKLLEKTASNQEIEIENHLSVRSLRCIEQLYGDRWWGIRVLIRTNPQRVLPTIIVRLDQKLEEAINYSSHLNKHMKERKAELHSKSSRYAVEVAPSMSEKL